VSRWLDDYHNACSPDKATFGLVRISGRTSLHKTGTWVVEHVRCTDEWSWGLRYVSYDHELSYAKLDRVTHYHINTVKVLGASYVDNIRPLLTVSGEYSEFYDDVISTAQIPEVEEYIKRGEFERIKLSQDHHTLIRPEQIFNQDSTKPNGVTIRGMPAAILRKFREHCAACDYSPTEAEVATLLLYTKQAPDWAVIFVYKLLEIATNIKHFWRLCKTEGIRAKQQQGFMRNDLSVIFELHVLQNRPNDSVDWHSEKAKRETFLPHIKLSKIQIKEHAKSIFAQALGEGKKPERVKWSTYWSERWARMPTGSFVSQYEEDLTYKKAFSTNMNVNKTTLASSMPSNVGLDYFINRPEQIFASTSTKYEWAKVRALYGCDFTSFVLADFSMGTAEDCLPAYFPVGKESTEEQVERKMMCMRS